MLRCDLDTPLGQIVILHPAAVRVLRALGMDLALEHDRALEDACAMRNLSPVAVLSRIARAERVERGEESDWDVLRSSLPRSTTTFAQGVPVTAR